MAEANGIVWLASYPKSGNTWLRSFIDAYHHDREPDINSMFGTVTDQAVRWYQACSPDNVQAMEPRIQALLRPAAMLNLSNSLTWDPKLVKTHNANIGMSGCRLIPAEVTRRVVYLVRDPRDVALSYAKHFGMELGVAVERMVDDRLMIHCKEETDERVPHWTTSWARHVQSYAEAHDLDVTVVRYEDLKADPVRYFSWILKWIEVDADEERVARAVEACRLERLRAQEDERGFREASTKADRFFGSGATGGWREVLSDDQVEMLEAHAGDVMRAFGYETRASEAA